MTANQAETIIPVPVHRPKANWLVSFLNSLSLHDVAENVKLTFIATRSSGSAFFSGILSIADWIKAFCFSMPQTG